jgi:dolichyl-phosphate-mannose--protein O-mannosyl transferase
VAATLSEPAPHADLLTAGSEPTPRRRLWSVLPSDGLSSWYWTLAVTVFAFAIRLIGLAHPDKIIFDEMYYAKDAKSLLDHGVELNEKNDGPGFVAHPPLGKWCIALGEWLFGYDSFGWRISAVVAGTISVLIMVRLARRMFGSTLLGCIAGLLMSLDGLHFVSSRVALLDIFLMVFLLAAFACLVIDRDFRRAALQRSLDAGVDMTRGAPGLTWRTVPWWRIAAAVLTGCALGVKWSALWYVPVFIALILIWEVGARRAAGIRHWILDTIATQLGWIALFLLVTVATYLLTWTGWFVTDTGWDRNWAETSGVIPGFFPDALNAVPNALLSLWHYHEAVYRFHKTLSTAHLYQSSPYSWLFLGRPVAYYYEGGGQCGAPTCSAEVIALGTPALWWSFLPALVATAWRWLARRDWRAFAILAIVATGFVPWMFFPQRTMFFFYALPSEPFLVLAVTLALGMVLGPTTASFDRRLAGGVLTGVYLLVVAMTFAYFYPIFTGEVITYAQWQSRMWLDSWV